MENAIPTWLKLILNIICSTIVRMNCESLNIGNPFRKNELVDVKLTPREARESGTTYSSLIFATIEVEIFSHRMHKSSDAASVNSGVTSSSGKSSSRSRSSSIGSGQSDGETASIIGIKHALKNRKETLTLTVRCGELPIMVMSNRCHLKGLSSSELVALQEEAGEVGGYFIMNGIERVIRLLQLPRRNYALAIERSSYKNRFSHLFCVCTFKYN